MTPFYIPTFTWYEVSYLDQSMEIFHKQTLTCMGLTYTLDMTNLVGPLQEIVEFGHQLLLWTCCLIPFFIGLLVSFISISISNIFIQVHVIVGLSTNANIKTMIIISGSYRTYIYLSILLPIMQCPMHAIHILMQFKHKLRKCSYNQLDRV